MKHAAGTLLFIARFAILGLAMAFVVGLFWPGSGEHLRERFGLGAAAPPIAAGLLPQAKPSCVPMSRAKLRVAATTRASISTS